MTTQDSCVCCAKLRLTGAARLLICRAFASLKAIRKLELMRAKNLRDVADLTHLTTLTVRGAA